MWGNGGMEGTFWSDGKLLNLDWGVLKMNVWNPNPQGGGISRWGLCKVISAFIENASERSFTPSALCGYSEKASSMSQEVVLTRH